MPREERMFGDVVESSVKIGNQQWYTVPLSILVHTAVIGAIVIIPLLAADILPTPPSMMAPSMTAPSVRGPQMSTPTFQAPSPSAPAAAPTEKKGLGAYMPLIIILNVLVILAIILVAYFALKHH